MDLKVGDRVKTLSEFADVPIGSEGYIIEDYGTGLTVGWDLEDKPFPKYLQMDTVAKMYAIDSRCPIRDGFNKETELHFLIKI